MWGGAVVEAPLAFLRDGLLLGVLLVLAGVDLRLGLLPNVVVVPAGLAGLLLSVGADPDRWWVYPAAVGGVGVGLFVVAAAYPGGLGMGDVKMGGMLGAFLGPYAFMAVFLGALLGTLVAVVLIGVGKIGRRTPLPFGAFMAAGGGLTLALGTEIYAWYAGLVFG